MKHRTHFLVILLVCAASGFFSASIINSAYAEQKSTKMVQNTVPGSISGKITEVIDTPNYTYAEVDTGKEKVWAAGPVTKLKAGDMIAFTTEMPMKNFRSKSMKRDFPVIYFVSRFITGNKTETKKAAAVAMPHSQIKQKQAPKPVKGIKQVKGGNTIAEIYANKNNFKDKTVRIRGKVTKYTAEVMGRNWLHIRDSSTLDDLTITTDSTVEIDDVVIIEGKVALDKDFSYGYIYPLIVQDATITKE